MANLPVARLLASRLLAAAAQGHAPSAAATALRAYAGGRGRWVQCCTVWAASWSCTPPIMCLLLVSPVSLHAGPPMRKYKGAWNGKESRAEKAHKQDALYKQKLLREWRGV